MSKVPLNPLPQGTKLRDGKYTIQQALAQGAFGITYLAKGKFQVAGPLGGMEVEGDVAIKEFFMSSCNGRNGTKVTCSSSDDLNANYMQKFRQEAEHLSHLQHPGIVKVLELFEENNTCYYAMEFIDGGSLDDYIYNKGHIPEDEALALTKQIGEALSYMHQRHCLHLDLKPGNIMRHTDGRVALIDFGLTKQYKDDGSPETSTTIGSGTAGYAPIEQLGYRKENAFAPTLDIYAMGATLFKMLTGHKPADAPTIFDEGFPEGELASIGISRPTIALVRKAMEPKKGNRYQSVDELLQALGSIIETTDYIHLEQGEDESTIVDEHKETDDNPPQDKFPKEEPKLVHRRKPFATLMYVLAWPLIALLGIVVPLGVYLCKFVAYDKFLFWIFLYLSVITFHIWGKRVWNFRLATILSMWFLLVPAASFVHEDFRNFVSMLEFGLIIVLLLGQLPGMMVCTWREVFRCLRVRNLRTEWYAIERNQLISSLLILALVIIVGNLMHDSIDIYEGTGYEIILRNDNMFNLRLFAGLTPIFFSLLAILFHRKWGLHVFTTFTIAVTVLRFITDLSYWNLQRMSVSFFTAVIVIIAVHGLLCLPKNDRIYIKTMIAGHRDPLSSALLLLMTLCFIFLAIVGSGVFGYALLCQIM